MARSYSNIMCAIWKDADFLSLPEREQRMYFLLVTQPEISSCGTLPITLKRWAKYSADSLSDSLSGSLSMLSEHGYIVIDWDLEELLVRSFMRHDQGFTNVKRLPSILAAAKAVASKPLQQVVADELDRLNVAHELRNSLSDRASDSLSDRASDSLSDSPRSVVTLGSNSTTHNPQTTINNPWPEPEIAAVAASAPKTSKGHRIPDDFDVTDSMRLWAKENTPGINIPWTTKKFVNHFSSAAGAKGIKTDWLRTWQNWLMSDYERMPQNQNATARPSATDAKVAQAVAAGAAVAARQQLQIGYQ